MSHKIQTLKLIHQCRNAVLMDEGVSLEDFNFAYDLLNSVVDYIIYAVN